MTLGARRLTLVLDPQHKEVDATGTAAPFGILPVPEEVLVARLLLAVHERGHVGLSRGVSPSNTHQR